MKFSKKHRFYDWPNDEIPQVAAGIYIIWDDETLIYAGMSGRQIEQAIQNKKPKYGLITRLASHASGRLSGDQFCVYVANRIVIPSLSKEQLGKFESGELTLDYLTKKVIRGRLEYQFAIVDSSAEAYEGEKLVRQGTTFGKQPVFNPL